MTAKRASHQHHRIVTRFVRIPEPLADGKIRCPACSRVLAPTVRGRLRRHQDGHGDPCPVWGGASGETVRLAEVPPVVLPTPRGPVGLGPRPERAPSRLDVGSNCRECGKWLPGERRLCGACSVAGGRR